MSCDRCPRLRTYCRQVAEERKAAFRHETYWGRPVPGFGDPLARVLIVGLAPAAHGANRTGRVFTGDGVGASGDFLMAALNRAGLANISTSERVDDGLVLTGVYIAAAVRCAPPSNKPLPSEITACLDHLESEVATLPHVEVIIALGKIAWDAWLQLVARHSSLPRPRPAFSHGAVWKPTRPPGSAGATSTAGTLGPTATVAATLVGCYHPSRQNTNTGKVTPRMYDAVFGRLVPGLLVDA